MDILVEELIDIHSMNPSFKQLFKSKSIAATFIRTCLSFMLKSLGSPELYTKTTRISDKLRHLALMLSLDKVLDPSQQAEVGLRPLVTQFLTDNANRSCRWLI